MPWDLAIVTCLTLVGVILFVTEALRVDLVAVLIMVGLMLSGVLSPEEGFKGFSNSATVTIAAMFVLSDALRRTGAVRGLGGLLIRLYKDYDFRIALAGMMAMVAVLSSIINNTAVVAILLPLMLQTARSAKIPPTKVLMPLSFSAMFGGLCTLVGTSTNILVSSIMQEHQMEPIGMFEMAPLGAVLFAVGAAYLLVGGTWMIPSRGDGAELTESYEMGAYLTEVQIRPDSKSAYRTLQDAAIAEQESIEVVDVVRGGRSFGRPDPSFVLQPYDTLRVTGSAEAIGRLKRQKGVVFRPGKVLGDTELQKAETVLFEAVVAPNSELDGQSLNAVDFRERFNATLLAVKRKRQLIHRDVLNMELQGGDVLLIQLPKKQVPQLQNTPAFVVLSEVGVPEFRDELVHWAVGIVAGVIGAATFFDAIHISEAAVTGGLLCVIVGAITPQEAYESIDWQVIFLLAGVIPLGTALEKTGGIQIVADYTLAAVGALGPTALLGAFYLMTAIFTGIMSNQATAILLAPVAIQTAESIGADPRPFALAITFAASTSFYTPVGYQTNTLIYSAGDYRFTDFVKIGLPLTLIFWVVATFLLPVFWPF